MLSLFKKSSPTIPFTDKVWKTAESATKGMLMMAMMKLQQNEPCLIITFFDSEQNEIEAFLQGHQLKYTVLDEQSTDGSPETAIFLVSAVNDFHSHVINFLTGYSEKFGRQIYFPSHYPMVATEQKVLTKLAAMGFNSFVFCLSFDDPLLKMFGSENILPLLEKIGLEDEEALEHKVITLSINSAREKVGKKVRIEIQTTSPQEWFKLNVNK